MNIVLCIVNLLVYVMLKDETSFSLVNLWVSGWCGAFAAVAIMNMYF